MTSPEPPFNIGKVVSNILLKVKFISEDPESISDKCENLEADVFSPGSVTSATAVGVSSLNDHVEDTAPSGLFGNRRNPQRHTVGVDDVQPTEICPPLPIPPPFPSLTPAREPHSPECGHTLWPLSAKDEAFLMRYFVNELSLWVRVVHHHFAYWNATHKL